MAARRHGKATETATGGLTGDGEDTNTILAHM
jgi:hypothetical protein